MMRKSALLIAMLMAGTLSVSAAGPQQEESPPPDAPGRMLQSLLFPPELVMRNQAALGLTDEQRTYIVGQIREIQGQFLGLRWEVQGRVEKLNTMLSQPGAVDENAVLAELDELLALEQRIKRSQTLLSLRIRNTLTEDQLEKLEDLKGQRGAGIRRRGRPFQN